MLIVPERWALEILRYLVDMISVQVVAEYFHEFAYPRIARKPRKLGD